MSEKKMIVAYVACFVIAAGVAMATDFPLWIEMANGALLLVPMVVVDVLVSRQRRSGRK